MQKIILVGLCAVLFAACQTRSVISTEQTVEVYKSDESRQCYDHGFSPEEMQKQLGKIQVYHARKSHLQNVAFPAVCGGATGAINVYRIAQSDLDFAQKQGFILFNADD